jgi:hypothetical protein
MSQYVGKAYHPINGSTQDIYEGFSWPCLLCGCFWYFNKNMWGWGVAAIIISIMTYGIAWLVLPFFANKQFADDLLRRGYLTEKQWTETNNNKAIHSNPVVQYSLPMRIIGSIARMFVRAK